MDVDELPLPAAGFRRAGEEEKSGPAEDSVFRGGSNSYPADVMRPPRRCSSDFTSKRPAKLGMNEDVFHSLICEEKVDTHYLGHEVKPTLFSPNHEGSCGKSMKKAGTLPCAKRLRTEQPEDNINIDGFDDLKSTATHTEIGSESNQFSCPEKSEMVKKKRRRDGYRTDKKNNRASTRSKYDSSVSKTGFSCSDSVSGGNIIPGTYGPKLDLRGLDDLSLNELLDGSYKYANLRPTKGKKTLNTNDNLLLSVRKALSALSPPGAVDPNTKASLCLAQPNFYSLAMSESVEMDKHIEDSVPSSKVEDPCQANLGESIRYQPKVLLEKLAFPSVNDLDALLNLSISSPPLQSAKNVITLSHASLPPFSWSVNHNGSWKPSVDCSKQALSRNISHGKWLRIGSYSAYSRDYQSSSSELQLKRSDHNEASMNQQKIDDLLQDVKNLTAPAHRLFEEASNSRAMAGPSRVHIPDDTKMLNLLEDVGSSDGHRESASKDYNYLGNSASDVTLISGGSGLSVVQLGLNIGVKDGKMVQEQQHTGGTHGGSDRYSYSCRSAPGGCDQNSLHLSAPETWQSDHSPRATCAADILCEIKRKSRSKTSRSNTSGKTKWPKAPSQKTMKARKSTSSTEKTGKSYRSADHHNPSPPSVKHKSMSEKNGSTHKNTTGREPTRLPVPVERCESSARMERDLGQPRSLHTNPVRNTAEACGSKQNPRKATLNASPLGFGGTYIKDWSSRGRTKRI